jgi:hypothetical protein
MGADSWRNGSKYSDISGSKKSRKNGAVTFHEKRGEKEQKFAE